jgi:hypothetical protein
LAIILTIVSVLVAVHVPKTDVSLDAVASEITFVFASQHAITMSRGHTVSSVTVRFRELDEIAYEYLCSFGARISHRRRR